MASTISIQIVFERDLRRMTGYWDQQLMPSSCFVNLGTDKTVAELASQASCLVGLDATHTALFVLAYRRPGPQVRFAHMERSSLLHAYFPPSDPPHFCKESPDLVVLCLASKGYDVQALRWIPTESTTMPDELSMFNKEADVMIVMKYFCPEMRAIVTLGCWLAKSDQLLCTCADSKWLSDRLDAFVLNGHVAPLTDGPLLWRCFVEWGGKSFPLRDLEVSTKEEGLRTGDVLIWEAAKDGVGWSSAAPPTTCMEKAGVKRSFVTVSTLGSSKYLRKAWSDRKFTDFVIKCGDGAIACHRSMLAAASPVLEKLLESGMLESTTRELQIDEPVQVVESVLAFIYTNRVPSNSLDQVLAIADRYEIEDLFHTLLRKIAALPTPETIVMALRAVRPHRERPGAQEVWRMLLSKVAQCPDLQEAICEAI